MVSIYRSVLKIAWQILWRAKYLWIFGLFAVLASNSGEINLVIDNSANITEQGNFLQQLKSVYSQGMLTDIWNNFVGLFSNIGWSSILSIFITLVVFLILVWIIIIAQGALIDGAYKSYRKQASNFVSAFKIGQRRFWKLLGVNVIGKVIVWLVTLIIGFPLALLYLQQTGDVGKFVFVLLSFIILIPIAVIISFLIRYAAIAVVIKKEKVKHAIATAWKLFIKNWIVSIEMAILMFLITIVAGLIMIVCSIILAVPLSFLIYLFLSLNIGGAFLIAVVISIFLFMALLFWIGALLSTFRTTCWVILFDKIDGSQVFSKISRIIAGLSSKKQVDNQMLEE